MKYVWCEIKITLHKPVVLLQGLKCGPNNLYLFVPSLICLISHSDLHRNLSISSIFVDDSWTRNLKIILKFGIKDSKGSCHTKLNFAPHCEGKHATGKQKWFNIVVSNKHEWVGHWHSKLRLINCSGMLHYWKQPTNATKRLLLQHNSCKTI